MGMILVGAIAAPAFFPLAANGGTGGAFAYSVIMGVLLVRVWGVCVLVCVMVVGWMLCVSAWAFVYKQHPLTPTHPSEHPHTTHQNKRQHAHNDNTNMALSKT